MQLEGSHALQSRRVRVYDVLTDPEVLQRCIPGCEKLEKTGDNSYAATLRAGVGSIRGVFSATVQLDELRPPEHFRMTVEGKGQPGFLKGAGTLDLDEGQDGTVVRYRGDVQVGGTLASVGQRMIQGAARMMASQFFTAIEAEAVREVNQPPPKHGFFRNLLRWLKRVFAVPRA
ncbi:MAG: SRPBCC family protein [Acidobacteriota bacterium]